MFKSFNVQLKKYLEQQDKLNIQYYGLLRNEQVDEIELEPIEETGDNADDNDDIRHFKEFCEINNVKKSNILQGNFDQNDIADSAGDEIIYENAYGLEQKKLMGIPLRN